LDHDARVKTCDAGLGSSAMPVFRITHARAERPRASSFSKRDPGKNYGAKSERHLSFAGAPRKAAACQADAAPKCRGGGKHCKDAVPEM
jgi:hypothetical protein